MNQISNASPPLRVGIVGGGLAGLAAAAALSDRGWQIDLYEARRKLGGRAGSYVDRESGELIDHCQHVAMGCCTNYLDFCRRTGVAEMFERHERLTFFGPDGWPSAFRPSRWLPAPLHLVPALLGLKYLTLGDKMQIARAMLRLVRTPATACGNEPTVAAWLRQQWQSPRAIERFWQVVLVSALGESLERASLSAARTVFLDGFLAHREASHVLVPRVPLGELYDRRVADWLRSRGVAIYLESPVSQVCETDGRATELRLADGSTVPYDFILLAVPWRRLAGLLPESLQRRIDPGNRFVTIPSSPISSVHLWFDRAITDLHHAVLVGRLSQWAFARAPVGYHQVVISASHGLAGRERQQVLNEVLADVRAIFPAAAEAKLLRWQLITEQESVFSVRPGLEALRPPQQTAVPNVLLAGDWTRTGWPATMEGAVKSGYLAAEAVLAAAGSPDRVVVDDLPKNWLVRLIAGLRKG
jgi:squalene-associated FAD-dependent desaturase